MKNLHKIKPILTDDELSVIYWVKLFGGYKLRIVNNVLETRRLESSVWYKPKDRWNTQITMERWVRDGKPLVWFGGN